jgi:hypothetical protein
MGFEVNSRADRQSCKRLARLERFRDTGQDAAIGADPINTTVHLSFSFAVGQSEITLPAQGLPNRHIATSSTNIVLEIEVE